MRGLKCGIAALCVSYFRKWKKQKTRKERNRKDMPVIITLPDGSQRSFAQAVTVAEVAPASARAWRARRWPARSTASSWTPHIGSNRTPRSRSSPTRTPRPRGPAPFDRAPARLRGEGAVSRRAGDHRPGDRGRLLLRFLVQAPVHAGGSRRHREEAWRSSPSRTCR